MPRKAIAFPPPTQIIQDLWAPWRTQTLVAAVELDVFSQIAAGNSEAGELAAALNVSERGLSRLLDALVGMRYLKKRGEKYELEPVASRYLVRGSEFYMEELPWNVRTLGQSWSGLAQVIKDGQAPIAVESESRAAEFFPSLVKHIFPMSFSAASAAAAALSKPIRSRINRILDVAAGAAPWSIAFARAIPHARVTVLDFPEVAAIARAYTQRFGVADRFDYLEGNLRTTELPGGRYDLVILGQIIHSEGEERGRELIGRAFSALSDNGMLLIADFIPNDRRTGPVMPLLFGLNMLVQTEKGNVFTMGQYRHWLAAAGFKRVRTIAVPAPSPLLLAFKQAEGLRSGSKRALQQNTVTARRSAR